MNTKPQGELRPFTTPDSAEPDSLALPLGPFAPPLARLRGRRRSLIPPEACLVADCPVCVWRQAGLLDAVRAGDKLPT